VPSTNSSAAARPRRDARVTPGLFITFEGIDGAGKSSHIEVLAMWLRERGMPVLVTREPGGTPLAEKIRALLLDRNSEPVSDQTELLLMFAARAQHIRQVIEPALASGQWVLCDRFTDATYAYQGSGHGVTAERIALLERWTVAETAPDLTLVFDVPAEVARKRRAAATGRPDRFEREDPAFFERVRGVYLERARAEPRRMRIVNGDRPPEEVKKELEVIISELCKS